VELLALGHGDPVVLECGDVLAEAPPCFLGGTKDQLTLFFREVGAAADGDGGEEQRGATEARA